MTEREKKIYELIKEEYGEYASVNIFVNCAGITINKNYPKNLKKRNISMMNINGEFIQEEKQ